MAEHLAALLVISMATWWVVTLQRYQVQVITPLQQEVSAMHAANVALVRGEEVVQLGATTWRVRVTGRGIEVQADAEKKTYTFWPDAD